MQDTASGGIVAHEGIESGSQKEGRLTVGIHGTTDLFRSDFQHRLDGVDDTGPMYQEPKLLLLEVASSTVEMIKLRPSDVPATSAARAEILGELATS
jgi:hypothetical protein